MREILFRGKRIDINEWVEGYYAVSPTDNKSYIYAKDYHEMDIAEDGLHVAYRLMQVFPTTVGQYTGLTDKNGKKIFEGDIVRTHYANAPKAVFVETVIFDGGKFCATSTNEGCKTTAALWDGVPRLAIDKSVYMDEVEVIGNIHDDPDLLGGDDK